jgi:hypothetical protein
MARHLVEFITVDQQEAATVGHDVHVFGSQFDVAESSIYILAQRFIMVAGNQHHALAVACPAKQFLHNGVLCWRPVDAAVHRPEIDDVTDQEDVFSRVFAEEFEETFGLARTRAEVNVREENRADLWHDGDAPSCT